MRMGSMRPLRCDPAYWSMPFFLLVRQGRAEVEADHMAPSLAHLNRLQALLQGGMQRPSIAHTWVCWEESELVPQQLGQH